MWGAIPPSSGNAYYDAVNKELGATLKMQPADGNNYGNALPPLFAPDKQPDWIQIRSWNTTNQNFGQAVSKFVDLTPFLGGDKIKDNPNLANGACQAGVWNGKIYGLPVYPSGTGFAGTESLLSGQESGCRQLLAAPQSSDLSASWPTVFVTNFRASCVCRAV